jgi:DNA-binding response OmpR family regulator
MPSEPLKILIADADLAMTEALQSYFDRIGFYKVFVSNSGQEALAIIHQIKPSVIILEKKLPDIDGLELCRQLKADERTKQIPIIFLTAAEDLVDRVLGLEGGASDYITKPFSLRELEARIKVVLRGLSAEQPPDQDAANAGAAIGESDDSVAVKFDFPEEVRVPCEQYLLYFGQFLRDLGVQATSDLSHEAGQVLFTVKPTDPRTALDKIRAALEVYLRLPTSPVSDPTHNEIAVQRLEASVLRLQSDLRLASAELQAKNTTVEAQQLIIQTQKGLLSGEFVFDFIKDITPKADDKEELIGGIVSLTTYKEKGVEVNLAELYRKLKGLFKNKK